MLRRYEWLVGNRIVASVDLDDDRDGTVLEVMHAHAMEISRSRVFDNGCATGYQVRCHDVDVNRSL